MNDSETPTHSQTQPVPVMPTATNPEHQEAQQAAQALAAEISKAMVGQNKLVREILVGLFSGGHILLEGVPGLGKTLVVKALAQCVGGSFGRVQFTPDLMPADVTGHAIFNPKTEEFTVRKGPVFCNFLLADEINRAPAKTQAALLEVMQEGQVTVEGEAMTVEPPFMVLATQNPVEMEGTYPLPEAQLDRFLLKVEIDYPTESEEVQLVEMVTQGKVGNVLNVEHLQQILTPETVLRLQRAASTMQMDQAVLDYAVRIARATRETNGISVGVGPRGSIGLVRAARGQALLSGRDFVTPDDVKSIAKPALRHRIMLSPELEMEGRSVDSVLDELLASITAPRL